MTSDRTGTDNPPRSEGSDSERRFMADFQEMIGFWAEATSAGNAHEAQNVAIKIGRMAEAHALENPTPSFLLQEEAKDLESKHDWSGAEAAYRKVLALEESAGNFGMIAKAQFDLCQLLWLVGRSDEARQLAVAATASSRHLEVFPLTCVMLDNEVRLALERGALQEARAKAEEALRIIEPGKIHGLIRAKALTTLARCLLAENDLAGVELHLLLAWELLQSYTSASLLLRGPIGVFANWWEVKSQLEKRRGNLADALTAIMRAVEFRRQLDGPYALYALARTLEQLGRIAKDTGDFAGEELVLREAGCIRDDLKLPSTHPPLSN